jgi:hypothetical protein
MFERLRALLGRPSTAEDVAPDTHTARTRETGGAERDDTDSAATTGTGHSEEYVGRVAGQDEGFAGETGAEVRGTT